MKLQQLQILIILTLIQNNKGLKEYDSKPFSIVDVYVNSPVVDAIDLKEQMRRRRIQRQMIRNMEQKLQLDKGAFEQLTSIQNAQIQKLGELVKMNEYYSDKKGNNNFRVELDKDIQEIRDKDFKIQSQIEGMTDPYDYQEGDKTLVENLDYNQNRYKVHNYNDVVDQIYA